jgi:ppGpp synthetase/RelA/SpoT-type nucleotidyltranferase
VAAFVGASRPPKVTDRRTAPSSGYRAVHVVVFEAGLPVEVQVRTELQDAWAQAYERLADRWGRGIRYGEPPNEPESPSVGNLTRQQVVKIMAEISTMIDDFEQARDTLLDVEQVLALQSTEPDEDEHQALTTDRVEARDRVTTLEGLLRRGLALLEGAVTGEGG